VPTATTQLPSALDSAPLAVRAFVQARELTEHVEAVLHLGERFLAPSGPPELLLETDPEAEGRWLVIDWPLACAPADAVRAYRQFVSAWNATAPPPVAAALRATFHLV
jgi:hypothetical protein